jgi:AGCS family alanine or glycine:cation symporter
MDTFETIVGTLSKYIWDKGIPINGMEVPWVILALIGTGVFLTIRLGFLQLRKLGHGFAITSGIYDDPNEPGDVSHFQALTTALSATVGIGNIAGVALAIHWGGPGALFWMWMTAFVGMATKYSEVTLAQHYRQVEGIDRDAKKWEGTVSGGPMYYIERGLGPRFKPLAVFFALMLGLTAFLTGNAIQANTVADTFATVFGIEPWIIGLITTTIVGTVVIGGISRIGIACFTGEIQRTAKITRGLSIVAIVVRLVTIITQLGHRFRVEPKGRLPPTDKSADHDNRDESANIVSVIMPF